MPYIKRILEIISYFTNEKSRLQTLLLAIVEV